MVITSSLADGYKRHFRIDINLKVVIFRCRCTIHHVSLLVPPVFWYEHAWSLSSDANRPISFHIFAWSMKWSAVWFTLIDHRNILREMEILVICSILVILELKELYLIDLLNEHTWAEEEWNLVISFDLLYISFELFDVHGMSPVGVVALAAFRIRGELWRSIHRTLSAWWRERISHRV